MIITSFLNFFKNKMNSTFDILDPSWMCLEGTFEEQVSKLFHHVRLSRNEVGDDLNRLFKDVEDTLQAYWPGCELVPYGSLYQGTAFKSSDVDCFVEIPMQDKTTADSIVTTARDVLSLSPKIFTQISAATNVPVPIVKFYHQPTKRECDLTFDCPPGVSNSKLLWYLLHLDKRAIDLAVLVKYWAKVHNFIGPYFLRTYALLLMVVFYLQQMDMLPTVKALQKNVPHETWRVWNVAFEEPMWPNKNRLSLKQLLGGFFKFYSSYNYKENVISPFNGCSIARVHFNKVSDVPEDFQLYKSNLKLMLCDPLNINTAICVQDVFNLSSNSSFLVTPELGKTINAHFRLAAKLYETESDENFLKSILAVRL